MPTTYTPQQLVAFMEAMQKDLTQRCDMLVQTVNLLLDVTGLGLFTPEQRTQLVDVTDGLKAAEALLQEFPVGVTPKTREEAQYNFGLLQDASRILDNVITKLNSVNESMTMTKTDGQYHVKGVWKASK